MKILLFGGTGAIGAHLAEHLGKSGADVYVTTRSERKSMDNIHYIKGNAKDTHFLSEIMSNEWDAVVDFMNYSIEELTNRVDLLLSNTDCYYFLSSSRVYADTLNCPITEESQLLINTANEPNYITSNEYGLAKAKEEAILRSTGRSNWTIFRPYIIYSESRLQLGALEKEDWLYRVLQGKSIVIQESLLDKYTTLTYSHDATEVMASIILEGKSTTQIYNIAGSNTCCATWREVLSIYHEILERHLGRELKVKYITDTQAHQLRKGDSYYQTSYDRMFYRVFDNKKTEQYKSSTTYTSIRDGLDMCLSKFLQNPHFSFENQAQEALIDRFTGEFSNLLEIKGLKQKLIYIYFRLIKKY